MLSKKEIALLPTLLTLLSTAYIHLFSGTTSSSIYIHHTKNLILSTTLSNIKCVYHIHCERL